MSWWSSVTWDVARAGGVTAYVLLTLAVVMGLALSLRWQSPRWPRLITNELHSYLTILSLVFVVIHTAAVWIDPFMRFGWREVFIPLASHYRPLWMGLGIVAAYLFLAIWISTQVRPLIGYSWWRRLHALTFVVYVLATVHGIATGSDTRSPWALGMYAAGAVAVGALTARRFLTPIGTRGKTHPALAALTAGVLVVGALWTVEGPSRSGWNNIANNGQGNGARGAATAPQARGTITMRTGPFASALQGSVTQSGPDGAGNVTIRFSTALTDGTGRTLDIVIQGQMGGDGAVNVTGTSATLGASRAPSIYQGQLTDLQSGDQSWQMTAMVSGQGHASGGLRLDISLQALQNNQLSGTVTGTPSTASAKSIQ